MSEAPLFKPDKDFTKEVDKQLPEAQELAKVALHVSWARVQDLMYT